MGKPCLKPFIICILSDEGYSSASFSNLLRLTGVLASVNALSRLIDSSLRSSNWTASSVETLTSTRGSLKTKGTLVVVKLL